MILLISTIFAQHEINLLSNYSNVYSYRTKLDINLNIFNRNVPNLGPRASLCEFQNDIYIANVNDTLTKEWGCSEFTKQDHLLFSKISETVTLVSKSYNWCVDFDLTNQNIIIATDNTNVNGIICKSYVFNNKSVTFDPSILINKSLLASLLGTYNYENSLKLSDWPRHCLSIYKSFSAYSDSFPFSISSSVSGQILAYWLNYCGLVSTVQVELWGNHHQLSNSSEYVDYSHSECMVHRVKGIVNSSLAASDLLCLEDVINAITPAEGAVIFVSAAGLSELTSTLTEEVNQGSIQTLASGDSEDIHRVLRAFENTPHSSLHVRSLWKGLVLPSSGSSSSSSLSPVIGEMEQDNSNSNSDELEVKISEAVFGVGLAMDQRELQEALVSLATILLSLPLPSHPPAALYLLSALTTYIISIDTGLMCGAVDNDNIASSYPANVGSNSSTSTSTWLCRSSEAVGELGDLLLGWISNKELSDSCASSSPTSLFSLPILKEIAVHLQYLRDQVDTPHLNLLNIYPVIKYTSIKLANTESLVFVLIFISSDSLLAAQQIVDSWYQGCKNCHLFSKYTIFVLPPGYDNLRYILLQVERWMESYVVKIDRVVVLHGEDAVRGFTPPGRSTSIIPQCEFGSHAYFQFFAPVVVAFAKADSSFSSATTATTDVAAEQNRHHLQSKPYDNICTSSSIHPVPSTSPPTTTTAALDFSALDFSAFAGDTRSLRRLIRNVTAEAISHFSDSGIRCALLRYACKYPSEVAADKDNLYFNHNLLSDGQLHHINSSSETSDQGQYKYKFRGEYTVYQEVSEDKEKIVSDHFSRLFDEVGVVNTTVLQKLVDDCNVYFPERNWELAARIILSLTQTLYSTSYLWLPIFQTFSMSLHNWKVHISLNERLSIVRRFTDYRNDVWALRNYPFTIDLMSINYLLAALYTDIGPIDLAIHSFRYTLKPATYSAVTATRTLWQQQRRNLSKDRGGKYVIHYLTVASEDTPGLQNLKLSADLAGVNLTVIGLGQLYQDYSTKVIWYYNYLESHQEDITDDDVVVLMDAYDVLLLPAARSFGAALSASPTPIVFCAEAGLYTGYSAPKFYYRGLGTLDFDEDDIGLPKFLNSGCMLGRAGQVRKLLEVAVNYVSFLRDDQWVYTHLYLAQPHLISLDLNSRHFLSGHKFSGSFQINDLAFSANSIYKFNSIGLMHCNNMKINSMYNDTAGMLIKVSEVYKYYPEHRSKYFDKIYEYWDNYRYE